MRPSHFLSCKKCLFYFVESFHRKQFTKCPNSSHELAVVELLCLFFSIDTCRDRCGHPAWNEEPNCCQRVHSPGIFLWAAGSGVTLPDLSGHLHGNNHENAVIIFVVKRNRHLQKPMYYFLGNLSFLEICYVSVTLPRLLLGFRSQSMTISFSSCMTQLYFFISLMCTECVIWDRYLAVCHPLRYPAIMTHKLCLQLLILSWAGGFSISLVKVSLVSQLTS